MLGKRGAIQTWINQERAIFVATLISLPEQAKSKQRWIIFLVAMISETHQRGG
jgi:hypothetical protein